VIPLKWAHIHGGWRWSKDLKRQFANDYLNLVLVDKGRNRSKGEKDPGEWMPDNSDYHWQGEERNS
jgi:CRISPR/Cas system Type II protein with McrA/HNH and RuvC-like nuclease domain